MDLTKWKENAEKELKPCPFCGGYAKVEQLKDHYRFWIKCKACGCTNNEDTYSYDDKNLMIAGWNRRFAV